MANNCSGSQDSGVSISKMPPVSWSVSEQIYEQIDSDIKINRLLATYHPDDGIIAYERILKAFGTSSETVTSDTWQELIQTLPLPNSASEDDVKEVICKVTGLSRDSLIFCNGTELPCEEMINKKSANCTSKSSNYQNSLRNESAGVHNPDIKFMQPEDNNLKRVSSVSEEFLGFPPQEISVTANRIHGGQSLREILNCSSSCLQSQKETSNSSSKFKWLHSPRVLHKSNPYPVATKYRQTMLNALQQNKYIQLPITKLTNSNRTSSHARSKMENQVSSSETVRHSESRKTNFSELDFKWDYCTSNFLQRDKQSCAATIDKFEEETKLRQQEDIRKMDFVCYQNDCSSSSADNRNESCETSSLEENLAVSDRLKTCIQNFLSRAKQDIVVEVQSAPEKKSSDLETSRTKSPSGSCFSYTRSVTTKQVTIDDNAEFLAAVEIPRKHKPISVSNGTKESIGKKLVASNDPSNPRNNTLPVQNLSYRMKRAEQNRIVLHQPTAASEFANFKKQYCDTLFNIQKAKAVTANSLSVESAARSEPCYSNCSYQRQLLRQEEQLMTSSQFAVPQSGLLNIHRVPCTWLRCSNWKHPIMGELKFQQQVTRSENHKVDAKPGENKYSQSNSEA